MQGVEQAKGHLQQLQSDPVCTSTQLLPGCLISTLHSETRFKSCGCQGVCAATMPLTIDNQRHV